MKRLQILVLMFSFLLLVQGTWSGELLAQDKLSKQSLLSSIQNINKEQTEDVISLTHLLSKLEQQFDITFLFKEEVVTNKLVNPRKVNIEEKTGGELSKIIHGLGLAFHRVDEQTYVLYKQPVAVDKEDKLIEEVSGTVTDAESGETLPGVNIVVKGTSTGTSTDIDGNYELTVPSLQDTLVFSFIGYQTQELPINGQAVIDVALDLQAVFGGELMVVGYKTVEKGLLTGSVASTSGHTLEQAPATNTTKSLQGRIPGLVVSDRGGVPGQDQASILVRGSHTLGDNSPLIVIDGVPASANDLGNLSPNDIQEINVLKDASAAIYGARAANGVILVQTNRGEGGDTIIRYSGSTGVSTFARYPELFNAWEHTGFRNEGEIYAGRSPIYSEEIREKHASGEDPRIWPDTDWYSATFNDWAPKTNHNLSVNGGTENFQYFISGDYFTEQGMVASNDQFYDRIQLRSNIDIQPKEYLNIGVDLSGRFETEHFPGSVPSSSYYFMIYQRAIPIETAYYPNGLPGYAGENGTTPIMLTSDKSGWREEITNYYTSKISIDLYLDWITEGLEFNGFGFFSNRDRKIERLQRGYLLYHYDPVNDDYIERLGSQQGIGTTKPYSRNSSGLEDNLLHSMLRYRGSFGNHDIDIFGAYEQSSSFYENLSAGRNDLYSGELLEIFAGPEDGRTVDGSSSETGRINYFGSISYNYMRKYMLDFSLRHDGSFNFPKGQRFGTFPGVSVGWVISEESFMSGTNDWLNNFKLRASYAKMGNDRIAEFQFMSQYRIGQNYFFGDPATYNEGLYVATTPNPNITWEVSKNQNYGFDAVLLDEKLSIGFDYFYSKRRDILITRSASVPLYTALELPAENLGKVDNSGVELTVDYRSSRAGDLNYNIGGNFTFNRNKIVYMDEAEGIPEYQKQEGFPMHSYLVYETDGIFRDEAELEKYPHLPNAQPGDLIYLDTNEDGLISGADRVRKYSTPQPEIQFGLDFGMQYKGFELSLLLQGQTNAQTAIMYSDAGSLPSYMYTERWTPENRDAKIARPFQTGDPMHRLSTYHLYDASFIKLKNVMLAYTLPSRWTSENDFQIYLKGFNLWTIFDRMPYKSLDPEVNQQSGRYYPQLTVLTAGVNIQL